jgi:hypothetical protein
VFFYNPTMQFRGLTTGPMSNARSLVDSEVRRFYLYLSKTSRGCSQGISTIWGGYY